jgi:hypothetical protein
MKTVRNSHHSKHKGKGAVELLEESVGLVRRASAVDLCCYALGTLPFVFYLLFFFAQRTGAAGIADLVPQSLALSLLFLWMKYWQSVYARRLLAGLRNVRPESVFPAGPAVVQATLQPWCFLVLPVALLLTIPFGWCYAFFQNVTVLGAEGTVGTVFRRSYRQAVLFPAQNLLVITIVLVLFLVVFVNLCATAVLLPMLLKKLLGVETAFSRSRSFYFLFNTSFLAFLAALTYLCVDPFVKAAYVLRCYYGECVETGADLLTEVRVLRRTPGKTVAALLAGVSLLAAVAALPAEASSGAVGASARSIPSRSAEGRELDRAIVEVMKRQEFSWPSLREARQGKNHRIPGFLDPLFTTLKDWAHQVGRWIGRVFDWLADHLLRKSRNTKPSVGWDGSAWTVPVLMYGLLAILLSVCGVMLWRRINKRRQGAVPAPPAAAVPEPDIRDEAVTPGELSGDRWHRLAGELLASGEMRLAIRALYFASIAHLAEAGLLSMDRAKSDRDYERELARRAHSRPSLLSAFSGNVSLFQRVWYGMHPVDSDLVDTFTANYLRMTPHER